MDIRLSEDQRAIVAAARKLFEAEHPPSAVRACWHDGRGAVQSWPALVSIGVPGFLVPDELGGLGLGTLEISLVLEEAGRVCYPEPLLESCLMAPRFLISQVAESWRDDALRALVSGGLVVTVCLPGTNHLVDSEATNAYIWEASGTWSFAATKQDPGFRRRSSRDASVRLAELDPSALTGEEVLANAPDLEEVGSLVAVGQASLLNGASQWLLDATVTHVKMREQFDSVVGSFQAVKHHLADVATALHASRAATWYAAASLDECDADRHWAAAVAAWTAIRTANRASDVALQLHGGIGFTWEHDLHFWMKRILFLQQAYGAERAAHRRMQRSSARMR